MVYKWIPAHFVKVSVAGYWCYMFSTTGFMAKLLFEVKKSHRRTYLRQCTFKVTANKSKRYLNAPILSS